MTSDFCAKFKMCRQGMAQLFDEPIPGMEVVDPEFPPGEGEDFLGYELVRYPTKTCCGGEMHCSPRPVKMSLRGWAASRPLQNCQILAKTRLLDDFFGAQAYRFPQVGHPIEHVLRIRHVMS